MYVIVAFKASLHGKYPIIFWLFFFLSFKNHSFAAKLTYLTDRLLSLFSLSCCLGVLIGLKTSHHDNELLELDLSVAVLVDLLDNCVHGLS